jgi:hypothetical protein
VFVRSGGDYLLLFGLGAAAPVLALAIDLVMGATAPRAREIS